ncbi:hypothetical protein [Roseateles sp. L2-2]|uniref:hypothetical protein n=1 Tax=Roseateles sp. L2-2 TaxID=3422597 RepID=UPI003D36E83D
MPPPDPLSRTTHQPLLGLRMGMVCRHGDAPDPVLFRQMAVELGAQVTMLDPERVLADGAALEEVAGLLGHLYGAIACDGLPPSVVRRLRAVTVVPVVDVQAVLASTDGPGGKRGQEAAARCHLAQAALIAALR